LVGIIPNSSVKSKKNNGRVYDLNFLKKLTSIQSKSFNDTEMMVFITNSLQELNLKFKDIKVERDSYGNLYVTKGKATNYPMIVCHTDTVHDIVDGYRVYQQNDILFAFSDSVKRQVGIGGDDKAGILIALQSLVDLESVKVIFFRNEEVGCIGSRYSIDNHSSFYSNCSFILQGDRKGSKDFLITSGGTEMCSKEFSEACEPYKSLYGFKDGIGISTDVDKLSAKGVGISCVNLSSGYYNAHSDKEYINIVELGNTYSLVYDICINLGDTVFQHEGKSTYTYKSYTPSKKPVLPVFDGDFKIVAVPKGFCEDLYEINGLGEVKTSVTCEFCKKENLIVNTDTKMFNCEKCGIDYYNSDLFKNLVLNVKNIKKSYVYSWVLNGWIEEHQAYYFIKAKSYVPKKEWKRWDLNKESN